MIRILIKRNENGNIEELSGSGHASFDEFGKDIVCAAVSALLQTAVIGLQLYVEESKVHVEISSGNLKCVLSNELSDRERECADVILETIASGLVQISDQYSRHVKIVER